MAPGFDFAMIALNKKSNKPSRFYVKGSGFTATTTVLINNKECHKITLIDPTLLSVALKYSEWPLAAPPAAAPAGLPAAAGTATGEVDVTLTVKDGAQVVDKVVTVLVVDETDP